MSDTKLKIIIFIVWTALIVGITWYIMDAKNNRNNQEKTKQIETGTKKIDSIRTESTKKLDSLKTESNLSVKKSSEILKKLNHEKIIVADTTYDAMCKYIENYRPK